MVVATTAATTRQVKNTHLSAGAASVTDLARSQLLLTFRGTGISWYTVRGPAQGPRPR